MDEGQGVISRVQADFADRRDSLLMPSIMEPLYQRLLAHDLLIVNIGADTNYSNGLNMPCPKPSPPGFPISAIINPK